MRFVLHQAALDEGADAGELLEELAEDIASDMRRLAPVDEGDMVSTVRVLNYGSKDTRTIAVGGIKGRVTGKLVDYAHFVERGTSKMAAQPFMAPATYRYRS